MSTLAAHLRPGKVYRREYLSNWSGSVDRDLQCLVKAGSLQKLARGLYYAPKTTVFGVAPPDDDELLGAFLKDKHFLAFTPNDYNTLRLGTTQLYNKTIVYNHKRHGEFTLDQRHYDFRVKPRFPARNQVTKEYLLVDMLNNLSELAEDTDALLATSRRKLGEFDTKRLHKALTDYGSAATRRLTREWLND